MKKWVLTAFQSSLSGPTLGPCRSAGREAVFCLRWGNCCPASSCCLRAVTFFQPVCAHHWQCGKKYSKAHDALITLSVKKKKQTTQNYNDKATPHESQAHQPCQGCPWCCAGPGLSEGVPQWLPALADGEQDLRFHGPVCCLACSLAVLVITSIVDIFVVIWALPRYGLLALGGKTGKADEGSLWVLKWLCVCFVTREGKAQVFLSAAFNLMSSWMDIKQFTLFKVFFIVKEAF